MVIDKAYVLRLANLLNDIAKLDMSQPHLAKEAKALLRPSFIVDLLLETDEFNVSDGCQCEDCK